MTPVSKSQPDGGAPRPLSPTKELGVNNTAMLSLPRPEGSPSQKPRSKGKRPAPKIVYSRQPEAKELEALGIKVVDYAYESTLPKLKGYRPRQFQPTPEFHKGLIREDTEPDIESSQSQQSQTPRPLTLQPTESFGTAAAPSTLQPSLAVHDPAPAHLPSAATWKGVGTVVTNSYSQSAADNTVAIPTTPAAPLVVEMTKGYIHTPTVTPNGSMQWVFPRPHDDATSSLRPALRLHGSLTVRTTFPGPSTMVDTSPTTPTTPPAASFSRRSSFSRLTREPSRDLVQTKPRRKVAESRAGMTSRYGLRSQSKAARDTTSPTEPSERKRSLRSHAAKTVTLPITLEAHCPTPKRKRSDTQGARPYYPDQDKPAKRRRRTRD